MTHPRITSPMLAIALFAAALTASCGDDAVEPITPTTVTVSPTSATLQSLGETVQLTATVQDQNGQAMSGITVAWTSNDPAVGTVDESGLMTAVGNGTVTVTATAWSATGTAFLTVDQVAAEVVVDPATDTLLTSGDTLRLSADALDSNGNAVAGAVFAWASTDTLVAVVDDEGLVTGISAGEVEVTATSEGSTGRARLTVAAPVPTTVAISPDTVAFTALGQTARLAAEVRDQVGRAMEGEPVSWSSADTLVATVDSAGLVTATGTGATTVAAAAGSASATAVVTVTQSAGSVVVLPPAATIALGDTLRLTAEAFDENGHVVADAEFDWSSSDLSVARVDESGLVTAVGEGRTTVTVEADGARAASEIAVENPDRAALVALYNATDGPNWVDNTNWLTDAPLGEWYGVDTDASGRVFRLNLQGGWDREAESPVPHGLRGPVPSQLGGLDRLRDLFLQNNALWGPIPKDLGNLTDLIHLWLGNNRLSGQIPPELSDLTELRTLVLAGNSLEGAIPPWLGKLDNLEHLSLDSNQLSGPIPAELGNLGELRALSLGRNKLDGTIPPSLGKLANLSGLSLQVNHLSGPVPSELGALSNLRRLYLHGNNWLSGPLPQTLVDLHLDSFTWACGVRAVCAPENSDFISWMNGIGYHNPGPFCNSSDRASLINLFDVTGGDRWAESSGWLTTQALEEWHGVTVDSLGMVTAIDLPDNGLSGGFPGNVADLVKLKSIDINGNPLSGRLPLSLTSLDLDEFAYSRTELCEPADEAFGAWLSRIAAHDGTGTECPPMTDRDVLVALYEATGGPNWRGDHNWLSDVPLGQWQGVNVDGQGRVVNLSLNGQRLSGVIPPELGSLSDLWFLSLANNDLSGAIPAELGNLSSLKVLRLEGNELSGTIPAEIGALTMLERLHLGRNHLSGSIPTALGELNSLEDMELYANELLGALPPQLGRLLKLRELDLSSNGLSGKIPTTLGNLQLLERLSLSQNSLSGAVPATLGTMRSLAHMDLFGNELSGVLPSELGQLGNLRSLNVSANNLSGAIPAEFGNLGQLESLDLSWNDLSGRIAPGLGSMKNLSMFIVTGNRELNGPIPGTFKDLRLESLQAGGTELCIPKDSELEGWLAIVPEHWVGFCGEVGSVLVQAVQSRTHPVPLVAGESALLRVFVTAMRETSDVMPEVRVRLFLGGSERHVLNIPGNSNVIPTDVMEGDLSKSANVEIPGRLVQPGLEMIIEIDPSGALDPGLGVPKRIPETGRLAMNVRNMPVLDLTLIPFLLREAPDSVVLGVVDEMAADSEAHDALEETRNLLPVGGLKVRAHEPVVTTSLGTHIVLPQVQAIRAIEGGSGHYMGLASGGTTPIPRAVIGGRVSVSDLRPAVIAHELGHNMSLRHAPCGGAPGPDPWFPYPDGSVGSWGYDARDGRLVRPDTPDLMSYCRPNMWISDYSFTKALRYRLVDEVAQAHSATSARNASLLLWGGVDPGGKLFLNPAFVVDSRAALPDSSGAHTLTGRDRRGGELFSLNFAMPVVADGDGIASSFAFALPVQPGWEDFLATITLSGPDDAVTLNGDTDRPMAILRDPVTGQVRGFLSDLPPQTQAAMDAAERAVAPGLQILFSRGIPNATEWRR